MDFTLPPLTQQSFSRWYNKKVPRADNVEERIVYPGLPLTCSTKSRDLRSEIEAKHVFITHEPAHQPFSPQSVGFQQCFCAVAQTFVQPVFSQHQHPQHSTRQSHHRPVDRKHLHRVAVHSGRFCGSKKVETRHVVQENPRQFEES